MAVEFITVYKHFKRKAFENYVGQWYSNELIADLRDRGYDLVPVYERPEDWWTTSPSKEVRNVAIVRSVQRNATEQARQMRQAAKHSGDVAITGSVTMIASMLDAGLSSLILNLPDPDREDDITLNEIDYCIERGLEGLAYA